MDLSNSLHTVDCAHDDEDKLRAYEGAFASMQVCQLRKQDLAYRERKHKRCKAKANEAAELARLKSLHDHDRKVKKRKSKRKAALTREGLGDALSSTYAARTTTSDDAMSHPRGMTVDDLGNGDYDHVDPHGDETLPSGYEAD